jgi:chemotaxis protein MotB
MARREKKSAKKGGSTWLITFSDMMTLMLTFFVLLVSMATIDERRRLVVLGSIIGTFGMGTAGYDARSTKDTRVTVEPGPMENIDNLEPLKDLLWEDLKEDIEFQSNKYVQIISINDRVLFNPGETELSNEGRKVIDRTLPILLRLREPLLLAGHTSVDRDEVSTLTEVQLEDKGLDPSWSLSFQRTMSMYRYLLSRGMDPDLLRMEAFGMFRPMYSDQTPRGRMRNRRVDIVLDKRNRQWVEKLQPKPLPQDRDFFYKDFRFELDLPPDDARDPGV